MRSITATATLLAALALGTQVALPQSGSTGWKLLAVSVNGSQRLPEGEIVAASGLKLAEAVTLNDLRAAADRLVKTGAFAEVGYKYSVEGGAVTADYQVTDGKQFFAARFANFIWLPESQLLAELHSRVPLFQGEVSPAGEMINNISRTLESILKDRGIAATADGTALQERMGGPVTAIVFKVHGPSLPIHEVIFTGDSAVGPA